MSGTVAGLNGIWLGLGNEAVRCAAEDPKMSFGDGDVFVGLVKIGDCDVDCFGLSVATRATEPSAVVSSAHFDSFSKVMGRYLLAQVNRDAAESDTLDK
ncbi:hypothetical protein QBL02_05285 [Leucobacter sp. UT-8R-CII-1-4]|uniref:hypothetical protein n=1 Tax=Leucobacter sp. UT-8R-CII-1-4 TaxID=3040075 RepID=UPI0024A99C72|nr:hypothetical protein [Leucobacter sp. UT-8R-CII-1-4]MDI6022954.1 hypothetical protein [Leucobacter sp. UT-8R-CII-1-4]